MFNFNLPLRIFQTLLSIITIGLNAHITSWYLKNTHPRTIPSSPPILITIASLTLLTLPYLFLNPALSISTTNKPPSRFFNKYVLLTLDTLFTILWLVAFIRSATFEHGFIAYFGIKSYGKCGGHVCLTMLGAVVMAALACATFVGSMTLAVMHVLRTRTGGEKVEEHKGWVGMGEVQKN